MASPSSNQESTTIIHQGPRHTDSKKLKNIFALQPVGDDIAVAKCDRLTKSAFVKSKNIKTE